MTVESLAKKDKIGRMRTKVICAMDEIVVSEKTYLTKLQELVEEILVPCQASDLFDSAEIATLFGNVRELMEYHKNFSFQLSQCEEIEHLTKATKFYTEITRIAPYRRTGRDLCSNTRPYTTLNRTNGTLNREMATSSMSLRASVRHSKLFESPLKLIKNVTERTPSRKSEKLAVPKKIRRRHSVHFRDHDDSSSLSDSSSSSDEKPPENPNATPTRRPVKKSLSSHDCHGISSLQVEFLNSCLKKSTLNPGLPLPAHLLEPVQRVMRYTILLKTLRNHLIDEIEAEKGENCPEDKRIISLDLTIEKSKKLAYATNYYQNNETKNSQSPAPDKNHNVHLRVKNKATDEEKKSRRRSFERFKNAAENFLRGR